VEAVNQFQKQRLHRLISEHFGGGGGLAGRRFAVWGLAFKPNTDDMREAPSRELLEALWADGATVVAYDPKAAEEAERLYPEALADGRLTLAATKEEATEGADALVICTEWKRFMAPNFDQLGCALRQKLIFDGRNLYDPERLAELGWTVWNDKFRNGFLGNNPGHGRGWVLGRSEAGVGREQLPALLAGWPRSLGGALPQPQFALNYVESHDDHTSADLLRLALGLAKGPLQRQDLSPMPPILLRRLKLLAAALLLARGPVMLAQGQEWGRAKLRPDDGVLDGNAYCRDDSTNHLDWREREQARELVEYYRRLLQVRRDWLHDAFASPAPLLVLRGDRLWTLGYTAATRRGTVAVLLSGEQESDCWFELPGGPWWTLVGAEDCEIIPNAAGVVVRVAACSAVVLWGR